MLPEPKGGTAFTTKPQVTGGNGMKILVVDGDPSNHAAIAAILTKRGCHLLEVDSAERALQVAQKEQPGIAIVDILTPKLDRGEFVRLLRCDPSIARMPVIFYTDGYLEIASGLGRNVDCLLTPMLLCEEAIRGTMVAELNGSVSSSNRQTQNVHKEAERAQDVFTFAHEDAGERALIRPGDLIKESVDEARKKFPKSIEITSAYSGDLWQIEGDRFQPGAGSRHARRHQPAAVECPNDQRADRRRDRVECGDVAALGARRK